MAILPVRAHGIDGTTVTFQAAASGDQLENGRTRVLRVKNTGAAARTLTFTAAGKCSVGRLHDLQVVVPNDSVEYDIGLFREDRFGGVVSIAYSLVTGLTVACVEFGVLGQGTGTHVTTAGAIASRSLVSLIEPHGVMGETAATPFTPNLLNGNALYLDPFTYLYVSNGSASALTPTLRAGVASNHGFFHNAAAASMPAATSRVLGLFSTERWGSPVFIDWTGGGAGVQGFLVRFGNLDGFGVDVDSPPAMGASPVTVPMVGEDAPPDIATQGVAAVAAGGRLTLLGPSRVMARATVATRTLWVRATRRCSHGFLDDLSVSVPNGTTVTSLELPPSRFGPLAELQWDATAGLTVLGVAARAYSG